MAEVREVKQYCRYCIYLCVNNFPYCSAKEKQIAYSSCKKPNNCRNFVFAECEPEYQDALGENINGYSPRKKYERRADDGEQITFMMED